jgi:hypothetical protein
METAIVIVIVAIAVGVIVAVLRQRSRKPAPAEVSRGLRDQAFTVAAKDFGISAAPHQPFLVVMDIAYPEAVASVVSSLSGDASIYISTGGGVIGGIGHERVRQAAIAFVRESSKYMASMKTATEFPYPSAGNVRFYVRTPETVLASIEVPEPELGGGKHSLSRLFLAGQGVITQLRESTPLK